MLPDEIDPFGFGEVLDRGFLGLDAQSTLALSGRSNAVISDCVAHRSRPDPSGSHILPYAVVANSGRLTREASADGGEA